MVNGKRVVSMFLASAFTVMTMLNMPAHAITKSKIAVIPAKIQVVDAPANEYQPNDPVELSVKALNTKSKVQYRVSMVINGKRTELYKAPYFGPQVNGKAETSLRMLAKAQGNGAIIVYAKAVGSTKVYDSFASFRLKVAKRVMPTPEPTVAPTVEPTVAPTVEPTVAPTAEPTVAPTVAPTAIESVTATGAKMFTVKFNQAVDTTKAAITVKKSSIAINVQATAWNEAKTQATVTMASNLTVGNYIVTVGGLDLATADTTVAVENEKVAKIQFDSANAVLDGSDAKKVSIGYKIYNQYNEDITSTTSGLIFSASTGAALGSAGTLTLTAGADYTLDYPITVTALEPVSGTFATQITKVVAKAQVADMAITNLYNADSKVLDVNSTPADFKLVIDAKDQYGKAVAAGNIASDVIVSIQNSAIANVAGGYATPSFTTTNISGTNYATLALGGTLTAGTTKITIISKSTGKSASYDITVKDAAKADTLTLSSPVIAAAGEKFKVPFTAVDQFGNAITSLSVLQGATLSTTEAGVTAAFQRNYVQGINELVVDATSMTTAKTIIVIATTPTGKVAQLPISVVEAKRPVVVSGIGDTVLTVAKNGSSTLDLSDIIVKDQYGRDMDLTGNLGNTADKYRFVLSSSDTAKVKVNNSLTDVNVESNTDVTLNGIEKGSSTITLKVQKGDGTEIANSAYTFNVTVVDNTAFDSYEVGTIAKLYTDGTAQNDATHDLTLKVYGVTTAGTKVLLPSSEYSVLVAGDSALTYDANTNKLHAGAVTFEDSALEKSGTAVVTILNGTNGAVVLNGAITMTKASTAITTVYLDDASVDYVDANTITVAAASINSQAKVDTEMSSVVLTDDQYGITMPAGTLKNVISNLPTDKAITDVVAGDTFNVNTITANGKVITVRVIVK